MKQQKPTDKKKALREKDRLTRPPRFDGVIKEVKKRPVLKGKRSVSQGTAPKKKDGYTEKQLKDYQLRSKKH